MNMHALNARSFLLLLAACSAVTTTAAQLKVFRGTLVHSRVRTEMEVLQDYLIGFDEDNLGNIAFVSPASELGSLAQQWGFNQNEVVTLTDSQFLMPGFVELHINPSQYFGTGNDYSTLGGFSALAFAPAELMFRNVTFAREASMQVARHTLQFGITTVTYYGSSDVDGNMELARVVDQLGQRAVIHQFSLDVLPPEFQRTVPPEFAQTTEAALSGSRRFIKLIRELESPLIRASIGPELSTTTSPEVVQGLGEIVADETDVFVQIRFAQRAPESITTLPDWEAAGVLPVNRTMMMYCEYIRDSEMETFRRRGISIAHCPYGDINLVPGILDVKKIQNFGIAIGLGTDIAEGYSPSILTEMRVALIASRAFSLNYTRNLPAGYTPLTLAEGFYMATMGGAEALRLGDTVGNFEVGKQFDAILVDTSVPSPLYTTPTDTKNDGIEKFLYTGDDRNIQKVYVAGKLRFSQDGLYDDTPLRISLANNSPRIVGSSVSVDLSVSKPTQSLTCHLRRIDRGSSNGQDCSSLRITYPNLNAGRYVFLVVGRAVTREVAVTKRVFQIGGSIDDCTVNLINRGIVVRGNTVSIQFAANGDATSHICRIDRQQTRRCESPVTYSGLSSGRHSFQVSPHGCTAGSSYTLRATFTVA